LAAPVYLLYEIAIFCVLLIEKKAERAEAAASS
jgi:Sec-independent protein secretion pathway component TatC